MQEGLEEAGIDTWEEVPTTALVNSNISNYIMMSLVKT